MSMSFPIRTEGCGKNRSQPCNPENKSRSIVLTERGDKSGKSGPNAIIILVGEMSERSHISSGDDFFGETDGAQMVLSGDDFFWETDGAQMVLSGDDFL